MPQVKPGLPLTYDARRGCPPSRADFVTPGTPYFYGFAKQVPECIQAAGLLRPLRFAFAGILTFDYSPAAAAAYQNLQSQLRSKGFFLVAPISSSYREGDTVEGTSESGEVISVTGSYTQQNPDPTRVWPGEYEGDVPPDGPPLSADFLGSDLLYIKGGGIVLGGTDFAGPPSIVTTTAPAIVDRFTRSSTRWEAITVLTISSAEDSYEPPPDDLPPAVFSVVSNDFDDLFYPGSVSLVQFVAPGRFFSYPYESSGNQQIVTDRALDQIAWLSARVEELYPDAV